MSNMLEQAIIDAESLKEAARQSAEEKIVEHFSKDIKEAVNMILEQEDLMDMSGAGDDLSMGAEDPMAMTPAPVVNVDADKNTKDNGKFVVDQLPYAATTGNKTFVSIDLDRLEESIRHELEENDMNTTHLEEEYDLDSLEEDLLGEELDLIFEKEDEDSDEDSDENSDDDSDDDSDNAGTITEVDQSLVEAIKDILSEEMEEILEEMLETS